MSKRGAIVLLHKCDLITRIRKDPPNEDEVEKTTKTQRSKKRSKFGTTNEKRPVKKETDTFKSDEVVASECGGVSVTLNINFN